MLIAILLARTAILAFYLSRLIAPVVEFYDAAGLDANLLRLRDVLREDSYTRDEWLIGQPDDELEQLREIGSSAIPMLKKLLRNHEPLTRLNAVTALKLMGPEARPALGLLIKALNDPIPRVQAEACAAIAAIGPEAHSAIPLIAKLLSRTEPFGGGAHWTWNVSQHAKDALVAMGEEAVPEFAKRIHGKDVNVRLNAVKGLGELSSARRSVRSTRASILAFENAAKSQEGLSKADSSGIATPPAVSALIEALGDEDAIVRLNVAHALCRYGPRAAAAVPELANHLTDAGTYGIGHLGGPTRYVRADMARAIVVIGATEKVLPKLLIHLRVDPPMVKPDENISSCYYDAQFYVALAIGSLGEKAKRAEHFLTESLKNDEVKCAAAVALLQLDPHNSRAREVLLASRSGDNRIGIPAFQFFRRQRRDEVERLAELRSIMDGYELHSRLLAICQLIRLFPDSKEYREAFCESILEERAFETWFEFQDHDVWEREFGSLLRETPVAARLALTPAIQNLDSEYTRPQALSIIQAAAWQAGEFVPKYTRDLSSESLATRQNAAFLLGRFGPTSKRAVPRLVDALQDPRPVVRAAAAESLGQIGVFDRTVIEGLTACLSDDYATVRVAAAESLAASGATGKASLEQLRELSKDELKPVRDAALQAIEALSR